ncbi:myrosinase 1-like isoform X1 [Pieris brassicae]|uniref:myrosinase 1-like isoform X1 n=1 Tax=Pieris brassicae TaxID=7116 RepID=UPI001E66057C|nr:myrosinase 1-like isoform X1 [Pieris brassicae]
MASRKLPEYLKIGVATAAYQIEGAWNVADKTKSIWDVTSHQPGAIEDGTTGDDACKSYDYYKRDIQMLKFLGVDFCRFSVSWPRLFPNGFVNTTSQVGVEYYNNLINELIENKIEPVVTLYHWDLPQNLQDLGGWANPLIVEWFEDYSRAVYKLFGDRVKLWITINEPKQIGLYGYGDNRFAPRVNAHGIGEYIVAKNIVLAHARAWHVYDKEFRKNQQGKCGIAIATEYRQGATASPQDIEAGLDCLEFEVGLYAHPIFSTEGGFPEDVKRRVALKSAEQGYPRSRLPEFTQEEIHYVRGTSDFYGFNHYTTYFLTRKWYTPEVVPSQVDDIGATQVDLEYEMGATIQSKIIPEGIRKALNWVKNKYDNPVVMIFENGFNTYGGLKDLNRITYYRKYLNAILDAIDIDGCNITRYTAWSLMDNFEWNCGLKLKFGLFEVDYEDENKQRIARLSALWFKHLITTRSLHYDYIPEYKEIIF